MRNAAIRYVAQDGKPKAEHNAPRCAENKDEQAPGMTRARGTRGLRDQSGLANRERLLLHRFHIPLEEIVVQCAIGLGAALELA